MRARSGSRLGGSQLPANLLARLAALVSLAVATVVVARAGGPAAVGTYALLRVLPGLVGVLVSCGLPGAMGYFLSGPRRDHARLRPTIVAIMLAGGLSASALWARPLAGWPK